MKTYLLYQWDAARTSFWFVPGMFAIAAVLLSFVAPWLDVLLAESGAKLPGWLRTTPVTTRATLSALAGAMVTVTGTVFSITVVTLSLTSQQFGPRLLRRFMYDLPTQFTLGALLATGFYCLLLLRMAEVERNGELALHLSVLAAVALAVFSMAMLIVFIHHIAILIQAPHIVAAVSRDLDDAIVRLYPDKIGQAAESPAGKAASPQPPGEPMLTVRSASEGYIQAIDGEGIIELARGNNVLLRMLKNPGDFVSEGTALAAVWPQGGSPPGDLDESHFATVLNEAVIVGIRRTPRQDVQCAIGELVEVAVRSLSPGINDPFTAITCIDRLGASLSCLAGREIPSPFRCDQDGQLRLIARAVTFGELLAFAFDPIRQYSRDSVMVRMRLLDALESVQSRAVREEDRKAIWIQAEMITSHLDLIPEERDRQAIHRRLQEFAAE